MCTFYVLIKLDDGKGSCLRIESDPAIVAEHATATILSTGAGAEKRSIGDHVIESLVLNPFAANRNRLELIVAREGPQAGV